MSRLIIYRIYHKEQPDISYIGSTIEKLCKRWSSHKKRWRKRDFKNSLLYLAFDEHGIECFDIEIIGEFYTKNDEKDIIFDFQYEMEKSFYLKRSEERRVGKECY